VHRISVALSVPQEHRKILTVIIPAVKALESEKNYQVGDIAAVDVSEQRLSRSGVFIPGFFGSLLGYEAVDRRLRINF
jgi:hypothetical protein